MEYLRQVSSRAASTLAEAKEHGADKASPYEYTKAVEYHNKAREDAGHARYQSAAEWGRRSEDCSRQAIERITHPKPVGTTAPAGRTACGNP